MGGVTVLDRKEASGQLRRRLRDDVEQLEFLKSLRRAGKLRVAITVTLKNKAGQTSVARKSVVLRCAERRPCPRPPRRPPEDSNL
jgi:hypothetical protein